MLVTLLQCIGGITRLPNAKTRSLSEGFVAGLRGWNLCNLLFQRHFQQLRQLLAPA